MSNEELCRLYQSGNSSARELLIEQNLDSIRTVAAGYQKRYAHLRLDTDDYVQEGCLALLRAAKQFNPEKGAQFLPYAGIAVNNAMIDAIRAAYPDAGLMPLNENDVDNSALKVDDRDSLRTERQLPSTYETDPEHIVLRKETLDELHGSLDALDIRKRTWIRWRYGFEDDEKHSLMEAARRYQMTESWAQRTEKAALDGLRQAINRDFERKNRLTI